MLQGLKTAPFVRNVFGDSYLHVINGSTFNQVGADVFYKSHFGDALFDEKAFYIFVGSDSGLLARYVTAHGGAARSRYLFIELPEVVQRLEGEGVPTDQHVRFCTEGHWLEQAKAWDLDLYLALEQVRLVRSIAVIDAHCLAYQTMYLNVEQMYQVERWHASINYASHVFVEQQCNNMAENHTSAKCLNHIVEGGTAIVLAGGPSLDSLLPWVKKHRAKLFVAAVSRISRRLQQVGVVPDMVVAIDPNDKMFEVSKEMLLFEEPPLLVHAYHVTSLLLGGWSGRNVYLGRRFPWQQDLHDVVNVIGPTVTNAAIHVLVNMGFKQVLLAGVDLSYSQEGYSHAKGSLEYAAGPNLGFVGQTVALNNGQNGQTDSAFFTAIRVIAKQAKDAIAQGCQLINLSETAAQVDGVVYQAPMDVMLSDLPCSARQLLDDALPSITTARLEADYQACLEECRSIRQQLSDIMHLSKTALKHNRMLLKKKRQKRCVFQIEQLEKQLKEEYGHVLVAIKMYRYRYFVEAYRPGADLRDANEIKQAGEACFNAYLKGAKDLHMLLERAEQRLACRLQELYPHGDVAALCQQWQLDRQYARATLWQQRHAVSRLQLTTEQQSCLQEMQRQAEQLWTKKTPQAAMDLSNFAQFKAVQYKISTFFKQQDTQALHRMIENLNQVEGEEAQQLALLAKAHLAECRQAWSEAIACYHVAAQGRTMEFALSKLAGLLLQQRDLDNALLALDVLRQMSPVYIPQYAQLKYLSNPSEAIALLDDYCHQVPNDCSAKSKLDEFRQKSCIISSSEI